MDLNDTPPRQAYGCLNDLGNDLRGGVAKENDRTGNEEDKDQERDDGQLMKLK